MPEKTPYPTGQKEMVKYIKQFLKDVGLKGEVKVIEEASIAVVENVPGEGNRFTTIVRPAVEIAEFAIIPIEPDRKYRLYVPGPDGVYIRAKRHDKVLNSMSDLGILLSFTCQQIIYERYRKAYKPRPTNCQRVDVPPRKKVRSPIVANAVSPLPEEKPLTGLAARIRRKSQ